MPDAALRYSRQELVLGKAAQQKIMNAHAAIIGIGALGTVAADLLARAGIGKLTLVDRDVVEMSNLHRQTLFTEADIGELKAEAAARRLRAVNSGISLFTIVDDVNFRSMAKIAQGASIILDCTDNLYTRFLINDYARKNGIPWVHAGAIQRQANVMAVTPETPCFACTFAHPAGLPTCDTGGIVASASVIAAALQAAEALKILIGTFEGQKLYALSLEDNTLRSVTTAHNQKCPACRGRYDYLSGKKEPKAITCQCSGLYHFYQHGIELEALKEKLSALGEVRGSHGYLIFDNISAFANGRINVRAASLAQAKSAIAKYVGA